MKFKIHYTVNGQEDFFVVEGETIEEIRDYADAELKNRNGIHPWSEEL